MQLSPCRTLLICERILTATPEPTRNYEWTEFHHEPGIYYERLGRLQQVESTWKLVIKLDIDALHVRYRVLQQYMDQTSELCKGLLRMSDAQQTCVNIFQIVEQKNNKLTSLMTRLNSMYKVTEPKRGLINAVGTISKTLFGTMDAEDAEKINEQMKMVLLQQQTTQHVAKNQIKILNATIGHIARMEDALNYNDQLIRNVTKRMKQRVSTIAQREEIDEHLLAMTAVTTELLDDIFSIIDYLTLTKDGIVLTRDLPLETIIAELREATTQLSKGLHFPFKVAIENWNNIEKYVKINAYYEDPHVYTILSFPIITHSEYEIVKAVPLPIHEHANIFTVIKINHNLIAIDKENHHYIILTEKEIEKCTYENTKYTCEQDHPVYHTDTNAPCEILIYTQMKLHPETCEKRNLITNTTVWITLEEEQAWLYSTPQPLDINIQCDAKTDDRITLNRTGKIALTGNCKLTTPDVTLKTRKTITTKWVQTYLPKFNMTIGKQGKKKEIKLDSEPRLRQVVNDPLELVKLSVNLDEINKELEENDYSIYRNKYFVYPIGIGTGIIIIIITVAAAIYTVKRRNKKNRL